MRRLKPDEINAMDLEAVSHTLEDFLRLQKAYTLLAEQCSANLASQTPKPLNELEEEKKIKGDYARCAQLVSALLSRKYELEIGLLRQKIRDFKSKNPDLEYLLFEQYEEIAQKNLSVNLEFIKLSSHQQFEKRFVETDKLILMHAVQLKKAAEIKRLSNRQSALNRNDLFASVCRIIAEHQSDRENSFNPVPLVLSLAMGMHISARLPTSMLMQFITCDFSKTLQASTSAAAKSSAMVDAKHIWQPQQIVFALEVVYDTYFLISREKDNAPTKLTKLRELIMHIYGIISTQNQRYYSQHDVMIIKPIDTDSLLYSGTMKEILAALDESCSDFPRGRIKDYLVNLLSKIKNNEKWDFQLQRIEMAFSGAPAFDRTISSSSLEMRAEIDEEFLPVLPLKEEGRAIHRVDQPVSQDDDIPLPPPPSSPPRMMSLSFFGNSHRENTDDYLDLCCK